MGWIASNQPSGSVGPILQEAHMVPEVIMGSMTLGWLEEEEGCCRSVVLLVSVISSDDPELPEDGMATVAFFRS